MTRNAADTAKVSGDPGVRWVAGAAALTLAVTAALVLVPALKFAYLSPTGHVAIESAACVVASLMASLALVRLRRTSALADLLLFATLLLLATTNLFFALVPSLAGADQTAAGTWAAVAGRLLGSVGFLAAALAGTRLVRDRRRALKLTLSGTLVALVVIAAAMTVIGSDLPAGVDVAPAGDSSRPSLSGPPLILITHAAQVVIYALAAWLFARGDRPAAAGWTWIAVAMVLAAGARLNYLAYPSLYSDYVYAGDFLRLGSYLFLFGALIVQLVGYERAMGELGVLRERRRLARDLHDGLAQELAFITSLSARLARTNPEATEQIRRSAERALLESRMAISALMREGDEPLEAAFDRVAREAARGRAEVVVAADAEARLDPAVRDALLRIVAEAAGNAVRHGAASALHVTLDNGDGVLLRVRDDGTGFDPSLPRADGRYGLGSMEDRARALGGTLRISSVPGEGTTVEVHIP